MTPAGADWRALAAHAPATLLVSGPTVLWASPDVARFVATAPADLAGTDVLDLVDARDRDRAARALARAADRPGQRLGPVRVRPRDRPDLRVEVVARSRAAGHLVLAAWDVTERLAAERELGHRAGHDALTGLPDRALLAERWARARARAGTGLRTFVLVCDLDGLKGVNDTFGHPVGDTLIVDVARRLAAEVRPGDTVARLGGDEFVVLVGPAPAGDVQALARRLRRSVLEVAEAVGVGPSVGLSVGWAADDPDRSTDAVLAEADARMYEDKRARRAR